MYTESQVQDIVNNYLRDIYGRFSRLISENTDLSADDQEKMLYFLDSRNF